MAPLDDAFLAEDVVLEEELWPCDPEEEDGDCVEEVEPEDGGPEDGEDTGGTAPEVELLKTEPDEEVE